MSPYEIGILMWYYTTPEDHADLERNPPVWRGTINHLVSNGLLQRNLPSAPTAYSIGERGAAFVRAIQRVPMPRSQWVVDWPDDNSLDPLI